MSFQIHEAAPETPIVGRVMDKHLSDELGGNLTVVVDGIDGRTHHIAGIEPERLEGARIGSVIQIGLAEATARASDRTITANAEDGIYRPSRHLEQAKFEGGVPAATMKAMSMPTSDDWRHRAGPGSSSGSTPTDCASPTIWSAARATTMPAVTGKPAFASFLLSNWTSRSARTARPAADGETADLASAGFGQQVREATDQRRSVISNGATPPASRTAASSTGATFSTLRERDVARVGGGMAASQGLPFRPAADGESVNG